MVPGHLLIAVEDADRRLGGDERERLSNERVRDGVVVAIEADVGRLARRDGLHVARVEAMLGQREETLLLLGEGLRDGPRVIVRERDARERCGRSTSRVVD